MVLTLTLPTDENWNPVTEEFVIYPEATVSFNHCLLSVAKWEEIWKKPFLRTHGREKGLSVSELLSYIECMVEGDIPENLAQRLTREHLEQISEYIKDKKTATILKHSTHGGSGDFITSEYLYYYLSAYQMPFDICERWHLSRLLTLLEIASIKNTPEKKMSKGAILSQNAALNKARRAGRPG